MCLPPERPFSSAWRHRVSPAASANTHTISIPTKGSCTVRYQQQVRFLTYHRRSSLAAAPMVHGKPAAPCFTDLVNQMNMYRQKDAELRNRNMRIRDQNIQICKNRATSLSTYGYCVVRQQQNPSCQS